MFTTQLQILHITQLQKFPTSLICIYKQSIVFKLYIIFQLTLYHTMLRTLALLSTWTLSPLIPLFEPTSLTLITVLLSNDGINIYMVTKKVEKHTFIFYYTNYLLLTTKVIIKPDTKYKYNNTLKLPFGQVKY